ncbi:MAG: ExeM/NucH family extracellular endonuclease, partial [Nocardioides sp.]|uniref:ExeM/NucH family extracellular endonuclease n=1 Tax=Nocardioides sp. TaxID=35761 RepID=UPI003264657D
MLATPLALGVAALAQAAVSHLVISEAYGGGGNAGGAYKNDFVEIFNPTDSPITMTNWSVQYRAVTNGSVPAASGITALNGTVPAHGYFLVQLAVGGDATQPALPAPDATGTIAMQGSNFQVWLASTTVAQDPADGNIYAGTVNPNIVDLIGVGPTALSYEGAGRAPIIANGTSAARTPEPGTDTDVNSADFVTGTPTPKNSTNRFPELVKPTVVVSEVFTQGVVDGPFGEDFVEIFNTGAANANLAEVTYAVSGGTATALTGTLAPGAFQVVPVTLDDANGSVQLTWTNDSSSIDLVGWGTGAHEGATAAPAGSATESAQRNQDNTDTNVNGTDFSAHTPTRGAAYEPPALPLTTIAAVQGTGAGTPLAGQVVRTEGVVTASFGKTTEDWQGFYLQTGGTPNTPGASDAIWVATGTLTAPVVGESVSVTGTASETFGLTTVTVTRATDIDPVLPALPAVIAGDTLPGADCVINGDDSTNCATGSTLAGLREEHESELFLPTAPFTISDSYDGSPWANSSSSNFGEIGLAANATKPLYLPFDSAHPVDDPQLFASLLAYNAAHMVTLDDGSNRSWSGSANTGLAFPWMTSDYTVRVGAAATFHEPFVYDFRFGKWRLQPQTAVAPGSTGAAKVSFAQNRPAAPDPVNGNVKIATFNMLNYFVHAAEDWDNLPNDAVGTNRSCSYYTDRAGNRITANTCTWKDLRNNPPSTLADIGPRGAATEASLLRQEGKEVAAINTMAADVMSLEEVENPVKIGYADRDAALTRLVAALNADWAAKHDDADDALGARWALVASPRPEAQPTIAEQDAIRNAFIYNPRVITTVGRSQILVNSPAMRNAREPLAQAFRHVDGTRDDGFIVIANHFKSKGAPDDPATVAGTDNADAGLGAGFYNGDRIRQARALDAFAQSVAEDKGIPAVFMTGDYNAYGAEDPVRVLEDADWTNLEPTNGESSYSFGGLAGSLDHVFANPAAFSMVTGQTIWPINANESVYYEYSRYNYNVAQLFDGTDPFRSSDHNPEIIGINAPINPGPTDVDTVQVLASNDFHGRLLDDPSSASAGAAAMAGAVKGLRDPVTGNPNTVFAMAGDIVGASTFESFIQNDKPTLDAMNEAGLEVSAAGNHEFDQGYDDLMNRIMTAYDATDNPEGGANWPYIAANVRLGSPTGPYALESDRTDGNFANSNGATWWKNFSTLDGGNGIRVGFVGAVTEDLGSLVAPSAIDGLAITNIVNEVNDAADALRVDGCGGAPCDVVIELVHEGAPSPSCTTIKTDTTSTFGQIVHGANDNVDAIVSGHTHLKYNCKVDQAG